MLIFTYWKRINEATSRTTDVREEPKKNTPPSIQYLKSKKKLYAHQLKRARSHPKPCNSPHFEDHNSSLFALREREKLVKIM